MKRNWLSLLLPYAGKVSSVGNRFKLEACLVVLEAKELRKSYDRGLAPVEVLKGVNLLMERGDFVALMGPSGCGKSTLLHLCGAMDLPTSGSVAIENVGLGQLTDSELTRLRRSRIGFIFQFFNLLSTLTVLENVALPLQLAGYGNIQSTKEAEDWLAKVGLEARFSHYPQQLSGGEMQRAAIARALIHKPAILIADEPTGSLDTRNGERVLQLLKEMNDELGIAVLLATHSPEIAANAKTILHMRDGRIVNE
jgi:putative ABC transport system ATP-binding protein